MTKRLALIIILCSSGESFGALLTNFAGSYARYQQCSIAMGTTLCYKLYFDPPGVLEGQITAFVDVPVPVGGRFDEMNGIIPESVHPDYDVIVQNTAVINLPGRQRFEATIDFTASTLKLPQGPITIFGYEIHDVLPELGLAGVVVGFEWKGSDHLTIFDDDTQQFTLFNESQLQDVILPLDEASDFDADGDSDGADFLTWQRAFGVAGGGAFVPGDADGDGGVDEADLAEWRRHFGDAAPAAAVPEPGAIGLGACAAILAVGWSVRQALTASACIPSRRRS